MAGPRRLVLFVEGEGDVAAVPVLVRQLLTDFNAWSDLFLDPHPFRVGNVSDLFAHNGRDWLRYLGAANKRSNLGGVLVLLDGDLDRVGTQPFCAAQHAQQLGQQAHTAGAGSLFSVATVFACQEYESWILAAADQLAGLPLPDGRPGLQPGTIPPTSDLELAPRDAKRWLRQHMAQGYSPTDDQEPLTQLLIDHLDAVRARGLRSFRRLDNAVQQLLQAVQNGTPISTP